MRLFIGVDTLKILNGKKTFLGHDIILLCTTFFSEGRGGEGGLSIMEYKEDLIGTDFKKMNNSLRRKDVLF